MDDERQRMFAEWSPTEAEVSEAVKKTVENIGYYTSPEFLCKFDLTVIDETPYKKVFGHYPLAPDVTKEDLLCMNAIVIIQCQEYGIDDLDMYVSQNDETGLFGHALEMTLSTPISHWIQGSTLKEVN